MPAIDPYKESSRLVNQRKKEAAGPPDLKKPFVRDRKGRGGKKPEPEPEPEYQEDEEFDPGYDPDLDRDVSSDDLPDMPGEGQYVEPEQPRIPEPPLSTAYVPQPASPSYEGNAELDKQVKLFYTYNLYMRKYLETFKKYLTYQKGLIIEQDEINGAIEAAAKQGLIPASSAQTSVKKTPVQSLANDPQIVSEEEQKKNKRNMIVKLGLGVMMIGGGVYSAILAQLAPIVVIAFMLTGLGSALLVGAVMK